MTSMLVSEKQLTPAHKMRHEAAKIPGIDAYGKGVGRYVESKATALRDHRFAVVIENDNTDWWFTEKLIDCFSQGTVPIYRGCPSIGRFFDLHGIIRWNDPEELEAIVESLQPEDYDRRRIAIRRNLKLARRYQCSEDWLTNHYGTRLWATS
jgi:hypothetical protein